MFSRKLLIITSLVVFLLSLTIARNMAYARPSPTYGGVIFGAGSDDVSTTTLFWGRYITDKFAVENAFIDMGDFTHGKGMDDIAFDLSLLGLKRVGESAEIYFKGGLHIWNLDDDIGEESSSYLIGLGVNKSFGQKLRGRLEWIRYHSFEDDVENIGILNLGLYTKF